MNHTIREDTPLSAIRVIDACSGVRLVPSVARWLLALLVALTISACDAGQSKERMLEIKMKIDQAALTKGRVVLESRVKNLSSESFTFLPWNTPFESNITGQFLEVVITEDGGSKVIPYVGRMVKRMAPTLSDYVVLKSAGSLESRVDITRAYAFCGPGSYKISFTGALYSEQASAIDVRSEPVYFDTDSNFPDCK